MAQRRPDRVRGPGHDEFWAWCDKGELRLQRCANCGAMPWPIVQACERCGGAEFTWERLSGRAEVVSWCTFEYDYYRGALPIPYDTILVQLEGGPLFISNPKDLARDDIEIGMPVELSFLDCEDAAGPFSLPVFGKGLSA
jgi:uncharacterized OB-fold protein